jgi:hypothetical protein
MGFPESIGVDLMTFNPRIGERIQTKMLREMKLVGDDVTRRSWVVEKMRDEAATVAGKMTRLRYITLVAGRGKAKERISLIWALY